MAMKIQLHVLDFMQAKKINWIEINHFFILFFGGMRKTSQI